MMDMDEKIIYVISRGDYFSRTICAVTTDKERAEKLKKYYSFEGEQATIEELINGEPELGDCDNLTAVWTVICQKDCCEKLVWKTYFERYYSQTFENEFEFKSATDLAGSQYLKRFVATVMAEDEEYAIKIAQDQMAKMLAEKEGL